MFIFFHRQMFFHNDLLCKLIDINLCLEDDICQLRIRDNGVNFNPLEYSYDHEEFDIHGIELVKKISKSMDYIRAIDMNNTIISF